MEKILLAGATGYLGSHVAKKLIRENFELQIITRSPERLLKQGIDAHDPFIAELTDSVSLEGCCNGISTVISTVGITRQRDGLTYMDVDYQANLNLLVEAKKSGVKKFIYVSVLNGERLRHLKICDAKEKFVDQLRNSGVEYCIIRPNGFFSDMSEVYRMAKRGRVYVLGSGEQKTNPIHGADLAAVCIQAIEGPAREIEVGGPEVLTHNQIADMACRSAGREVRITRIPNWVRTIVLKLLRTFTSSKNYGPIEFFLTVTAIDMIAPEYGSRRLEDYFVELNDQLG